MKNTSEISELEDALFYFFENNPNINFKEGQRNIDCTIISGYALYLCYVRGYRINVISPLLINLLIVNSIKKFFGEDIVDTTFEHIFNSVFNYARTNNYGKWWLKESNKNQYKTKNFLNVH